MSERYAMSGATSRYDRARSAFEFLESVAPLDDQVELDAERENLMRNPTKAKAADMYESGISLWFEEHGQSRDHGSRVRRIAKDYL